MQPSDNIAARLIGGLGNQLFILAHGYKLSKEQGKNLVIDTSAWFAGQGEHPDTYKDTLYKNFTFGTGKPLRIDYYQGERYFEPYGAEFVSLLGLELTPVDRVAVHVRRGDYVGSNHHVCDLDYYNTAIKYMDKLFGKDFTIFTDDPDWCREHFPFEIFEGSVLESFNHMASHRAVICSNSSFSYWASYISGGKTISPKQWYKHKTDPDIHRKDMICF